ncbi:MAG: class I SAM-dependent methyltransferase [Solirubrobacterales bacterium]
MSGPGADADRNRVYWDLSSEEYDARAGEFIAAGWAWGLWQVSEDELRVLGEVEGRDVLELGCGAGEWSRALPRRGARPVGLDNSPVRLERAREEMERAGLDFPLLRAAAESVPLGDASFDIVLCDWGATNFADPRLVVPEVARLLRAGGLFVFSGATPLSWLCWDGEHDRLDRSLHRDYFGMHRWATPEGAVEFNLGYGEWIGLFRASRLAVEDLIEVRPPDGARSPYRDEAETEWARRWPMEQIWRLRREAG